MKICKLTAVFILVVIFSVPNAFAFGKGEAKKKIDALNKQVSEAANKGDLQAAITAAEEVFDVSVKTFGEKSLETSRAMNNMANLYMYAGNAADAERMYKNAILIEVTEKGKDSTEVSDSYYNLGMAYAMQEKFDEARQVMNLSLLIRQGKLGASHPDTVKAQKMLDELWQRS